MARLADLHRPAGGAARGAHPGARPRLRHRPRPPRSSVVCIMAMPVIVLNSFRAVRHTPHSLLEMGRSFLGTPAPADLQDHPAVRDARDLRGLRLGCAAGFVGAILAELLDHADRDRRHHHLQPVHRRLSEDVRGDRRHHRLLGAVHRAARIGSSSASPAGKAGRAMTASVAQCRPRETACRRRDAAPIVEVRGVSKIYPGGVEALSNISLDFPEGELTSLLGPRAAARPRSSRSSPGSSSPPAARCSSTAGR